MTATIFFIRARFNPQHTSFLMDNMDEIFCDVAPTLAFHSQVGYRAHRQKSNFSRKEDEQMTRCRILRISWTAIVKKYSVWLGNKEKISQVPFKIMTYDY
jgi:hypothetical protein